ncbi:MAG: radical SAM protein [Patescibacteria group bacterium]
MRAASGCRLCPRACGADRRAGQRGWCGAGPRARIARVALHHWEEPPISGSRGSGAVFFSRCNLRCVFCQNHEISVGGFGLDLDPADLADRFLALEAQRAHNINLVSPTPYIVEIAQALRLAGERGLKAPVVYNSNAYERPEALSTLDGLVQVFLPDLKYADDALAAEYSNAKGYFAAAKRAIQAMRALAPADIFDREGIMKGGLIIRHLVLPGCLENTREVLGWIAGTLGKDTYVSLMAQYTPAHRARENPALNRLLTPEEYERALSFFEDAGLKNGFCQGLDAASPDYIPHFDLAGVESVRADG